MVLRRSNVAAFRPALAASRIATLIDKRSLDELHDQAAKALTQMMYRATSGDYIAIKRLATTAQGLVKGLEKLAEFDRQKVRIVAQMFPTWPVNLSLNPQEIKRAKEHLKALAVGTKAPTPTRPGQRVDPRYFWTQLAADAQSACRINRPLIPILEAHCRSAHKKRIKERFWGTPFCATIYTLVSGDIVVIADWQKQCVKLTERITIDSFAAWWNVVKVCVLQHWKITGGDAYAPALKQVGCADEKEWRRRNMAVDRAKQALRSLAGLQ